MSLHFDLEYDRKITVLQSGLYPVLKVENFLPQNEYEEVKAEALNLVLFAREEDLRGRDYHRLYLDNVHKQNRDQSKILTLCAKNLFDRQMVETYDSIQDTSFKLIPQSTAHETQLTMYKNSSKYSWHHDATDMRVANWVLMIDLGMEFEGGHTQLSNERFDDYGNRELLDGNMDLPVALDIKPKGNQLVIMPMWVTHRVTPIKMQSKELSKGRITVNGHIGFRSFNDKREFAEDRFETFGNGVTEINKALRKLKEDKQ